MPSLHIQIQSRAIGCDSGPAVVCVTNSIMTVILIVGVTIFSVLLCTEGQCVKV